MPKYRKKPIVIEAFKYDGDFIDKDGNSYVPDWATSALDSGKMRYHSSCSHSPPCDLFISNLLGEMKVEVGDYITQDTGGEIFRCKPDIFESTYELIKE